MSKKYTDAEKYALDMMLWDGNSSVPDDLKDMYLGTTEAKIHILRYHFRQVGKPIKEILLRLVGGKND